MNCDPEFERVFKASKKLVAMNPKLTAFDKKQTIERMNSTKLDKLAWFRLGFNANQPDDIEIPSKFEFDKFWNSKEWCMIDIEDARRQLVEFLYGGAGE